MIFFHSMNEIHLTQTFNVKMATQYIFHCLFVTLMFEPKVIESYLTCNKSRFPSQAKRKSQVLRTPRAYESVYESYNLARLVQGTRLRGPKPCKIPCL